MKHVLPYSLFENQTAIQTLSKEQVSWLDNCTDGTWQLNPATGLVDVDENFNCDGQGLSDFKGVRFGVAGGIFHCNNNQLTTLEGAPHRVGNSFICYNNHLTTLEGAPQEVGGGFSCSSNQITSLNGSPQKVIGNFACDNNQLTTLEGAPREVGGDFICDNNPVSDETLKRIFRLMKKRKGYLEAVESIWTEIPLDDQTLLYRPEFEWVVGDERKKLDALRAYQGFKGMI